jgi:TRAP-type C4-dicarboxylate transport system substrate-binding protein
MAKSRGVRGRCASVTRRVFVGGTAAAAASTFLIPRYGRGADPEFVLKCATVAPAGTPWAKQLRGIKKRIQDASGGRIKVKAYLGGGLGDEISTAEATKRGRIQLFGGTAGALASAVPELDAVELPYLFPNHTKADHVLDNAIRGDLEAILWDRGYKLIFLTENGWRSIGSNFGFVRGPADLKGKKMRSQESDVHVNTWRAMGASPVPMAVTEVLSALQTGVVSGFDNTPLFAFAASWYQGITHFTLTRHIYQPGIVVLSRKFYESLPKDLQTIVEGDMAADSKEGRSGVRAIAPMLVQNFENAGIKVHRLSASERSSFAAATEKVHGQFAKKTSRSGKALLKKIKAAL